MKQSTKNLLKARQMMFEAAVKTRGYKAALKYHQDPKKQSLLNAAAKMFINSMPWEFVNE